MAKHKLYRQFENTSPFTSSLSEEIPPERDVHPSALDTTAHVRHNVVKSKCADESMTNQNSVNKKGVAEEKGNYTFSDPMPGGDYASDSDLDDFFETYSKLGPKLPYSSKEDECILKFVLKGQNIFKVGSISLWKYLESKKENPKRTYQSLKNRFLRGIKPHIFSRYGHLISSDTQVEKILTQFPELKCKVGRTNTLSRIYLPARNPKSKFEEGGLVNGSRDNDERVTSPRTFTSDAPSNGSALREPIINLHFSTSERRVTIKDKCLAVRVNFSLKQQAHYQPKPVTPKKGIYEKYMKLKEKNKLVLCNACGRYNQPRKNILEDSRRDGESGREVLTANSLRADPGNSSATNSGSPPAKHRKVGESELRSCTPLSPNLLRDAGEEYDFPVDWNAPKRALVTSEVGRAPETPSSVALRQETDSAAANRLREADDNLDSTYEETVTDFKKLIKNEEERLLVRKCLHGKGRVLGLSDSISQISMESYFVELSPNLETPSLTIDYPSPLPTSNCGGHSSSLLVRNMMKMLEEKKMSKES